MNANDISIALLIGMDARAKRAEDARHLADLEAAAPSRPTLAERLVARLRPIFSAPESAPAG
jgi:hypothetical protein